MFINYLNNITSDINDASMLNSMKNYVNLNFSINTRDFLFIINNNDLNLENLDSNTSLISKSQINKIDISKYELENIDIDSLLEIGIYKFNQSAPESIDNYSISITSEVI